MKKMKNVYQLFPAILGMLVIVSPAQALTDPTTNEQIPTTTSQVVQQSSPSSSFGSSIGWRLISNKDIAKNAGIAYSKLSLRRSISSGDLKFRIVGHDNIKKNGVKHENIGSGAVKSDNIKDETIVNKDISEDASIEGTKINPDFGSQDISTTGMLTVGELDVTGLSTLDSLDVTNNATVGGTLGVTGLTTATGGIDMDGSTLTDNDGIVNVEDNLNVNGTLDVTGLSTLDSLDVTNNATVGGTLGVTGLTTATGGIDMDGSTLADSDGTVNIDDNLDVNGNITMNNVGDIITNLSNIVNIGDGTDDGIYLRGYTSVYGTLDAWGTITDNNDSIVTIGDGVDDVVSLNGNTDVNGTLDVTGLTTATGGIDMNGSALADNDGTVDVTNNATVGGILDVTGAVTADAGVTVDNSTFDGNTITTTSGTNFGINTSAGNDNIRLNAGSGDIDVTGREHIAGNIEPRTDSTYDLGATGTRWSTIYADTLNYSSALTDSNAAGNNAAVNMGNGESDTVTITANTSITDSQWSVSAAGAAAFASETVGGNNVVTVGDNGTVTSAMIQNGTIVGGDLASNITISTTGDVTASDLRANNNLTVINDVNLGNGGGDTVTIAGTLQANGPTNLGNNNADTVTIEGNVTTAGSPSIDLRSASDLRIPRGTSPSSGDACSTAGAIRIDTDAVAASRIIWCNGSNWQQP